MALVEKKHLCFKHYLEAYLKLPAKNFCESCLAETTDISDSRWYSFIRYVVIRLSQAPFIYLGSKKNECPVCGSFVRKLWIEFPFSIVPINKYRVLYTRDLRPIAWGEPADSYFINDILVRKLKK